MNYFQINFLGRPTDELGLSNITVVRPGKDSHEAIRNLFPRYICKNVLAIKESTRSELMVSEKRESEYFAS